MTLVRRLLGVPTRWAHLSLLFVLATCLAAAPARAHPHVWVTMHVELIYAADGSATGVRHVWTFDDMYSAFATTGIKGKTRGQFTRAELQPLAQLNVESLKDFAYFTFARIDGKKQKDPFATPTEYWMEYDPKTAVLTLHFTLPFKQPVKAKRLVIEIYDPEFFIDFGFAEKDQVRLVDAPAQCTVSATKPQDDNFLPPESLNQSFVSSEIFAGMGMDFANKITVQCP